MFRTQTNLTVVLRALCTRLFSTFSETGFVEGRGELSDDDSRVLRILGIEPVGSVERRVSDCKRQRGISGTYFEETDLDILRAK